MLSVPHTELSQVDGAMKRLSVSLQNDLPTIVACAGASTCKLGLCRSRGLASAIADAVKWKVWDREAPLPVIRISGCPNACAQHQVADIGFQGRARRVQGRLMPYYDVFAGARLQQGQTELGHRIGSLPAKRIPAFMEAVTKQGDFTVEALAKSLQERESFTEDFNSETGEPLYASCYASWNLLGDTLHDDLAAGEWIMDPVFQ